MRRSLSTEPCETCRVATGGPQPSRDQLFMLLDRNYAAGNCYLEVFRILITRSPASLTVKCRRVVSPEFPTTSTTRTPPKEETFLIFEPTSLHALGQAQSSTCLCLAPRQVTLRHPATQMAQNGRLRSLRGRLFLALQDIHGNRSGHMFVRIASESLEFLPEKS